MEGLRCQAEQLGQDYRGRSLFLGVRGRHIQKGEAGESEGTEANLDKKQKWVESREWRKVGRSVWKFCGHARESWSALIVQWAVGLLMPQLRSETRREQIGQ